MIVFIHSGETFKSDNLYRKYRYAHLADNLQLKNINVIRYALTLNHFTKELRFDKSKCISFSPYYQVHFIHGGSYSHNFSLKRLYVYTLSALKLKFYLNKLNISEISGFVISMPSIEMAWVAHRFCIKNNIPYIFDVRDLWPDIFLIPFFGFKKKLLNFVLFPYFKIIKSILSNAKSITSVSNTYLDWGLRHANRTRHDLDKVFPLGFSRVSPIVNSSFQMPVWYHENSKSSRPLTCFYIGQFETSYDIDTIVSVAKIFSSNNVNVKFILCGYGSKFEEIVHNSVGLDNVFLPGYVSSEQASFYMSISDIGLASYSPSAIQSLPNKPFEYMSSGLAVVSSLNDEFTDLLNRYSFGVKYEAGNVYSLYSAINFFRSNRSVLESFKANSLDSFNRNFSSEVIYDDFSNYLISMFGEDNA